MAEAEPSVTLTMVLGMPWDQYGTIEWQWVIFAPFFFDSLTLGKGKAQLLAREQKRNYDYDELTWDLSVLGIGL